MAGVVTSGSFAKALLPGINKWFQQSYQDHEEEWVHIFDTESSDKQFEEDVGVSEFGLAAHKPEGQSIAYDDMEQNFVNRYVHKVYAKGFIITREMYEDDQYGVVSKRKARSLARSLRLTKETVGANVLNNAFTAANVMAGSNDGSELIATDHSNGPYGGTGSNRLATDADLSEASLEDMLIQIAGATDPRGLQIKLMGECLIVPRQLMFEADRILNSNGRVATADNDINAINHSGYLPRGFKVNHYLTDTDAWFVKTNCPDGLKHFNRRSMQFGTDGDFDTENAKYKATERYSFGWSDYRGVYGTSGA